MYQAGDRLAAMFAAFTAFAVFIACLGLFGLVTFVTLARTREIGIPKVLGASVQSLIFLLSKDFLVLIGVAFLLSTPVAGRIRLPDHSADCCVRSGGAHLMAGNLANDPLPDLSGGQG